MSTAIAAAHSAGHSPLPSQRATASSPLQNIPLTPSRRSMATVAHQRQSSNGNSSSPSDDHRAALHSAASNQGKQSPRYAQQIRPKAPAAVSSASSTSVPIPVIKQERQNSTEPQNSPVAERHRPRRLDLSASTKHVPGAKPSAPLTAQPSASLSAMQDVGLACLSPGFQTQDPNMQQQLQRSMEMREQQRQLIEARQRNKETGAADHMSSAFGRAPATGKRKGPPPGLSIHAPSASDFGGPRAIQSAPLHQSFTGLNRGGPGHLHPLSRVMEPHPESRGPPTSVPTNTQNGNRLPPISDVFAGERMSGQPRPASTLARQDSGNFHAPLPSPGFPPNHAQAAPASAGLQPPVTSNHINAYQPHTQPPSRNEGVSSIPPITSRPREFKSAEEAVQAMSGGREDLQPRIVHYGGHQPPTPPSPLPPGHPGLANGSLQAAGHRSVSGRRRTRDEYERDYAENGDRMDVDGGRGDKRNYAPWDDREAAARHGLSNDSGPRTASHGQHGDHSNSWDRGRPRDIKESFPHAQGPFGYGRDSPETQRRKKEEFLGLCARAWDLFHS